MTLPHFHITYDPVLSLIPGTGDPAFHYYSDTTESAMPSVSDEDNPAFSCVPGEDDTVLSCVPDEDRYTLALDAEILAHLSTLRTRAGECFVLVDADGRATTFELLEAPRRKASALTVRICGRICYTRPAKLTLVQGISTTERMDQTIRQATELGISRIIPLESMRSTVRLTPESRLKKQDRWQRLARAAADQATCTLVPDIVAPCKLTESLSLIRDCDVVLLAWEDFHGPGIRTALAAHLADTCERKLPHVALFVGPEGGFDPAEVEILTTVGAVLVSLGRTILRTETAAVVASALVLHELGELGNNIGDNAGYRFEDVLPLS